MHNFVISAIHIYPIKSMGGICLKESELVTTGLKFDRQWMLIDANCNFITQRTYPELALLKVNIQHNQLSVQHQYNQELKISFDVDANTGNPIPLKIWDDETIGVEVSTEVSDFFSGYMQMDVRLVKMPSDEQRFVDTRFAHQQETVGFADGFPCMIIGEESLNELNKKLGQTVAMDRFRPNFVFSGGQTHIEDYFINFNIGKIRFQAVKPCSRCVMINIDQQTGLKYKEPLKTLSMYRTHGGKVLFGQNLIHTDTGTIYLGDQLTVTSWKFHNDKQPPNEFL